MTSQKKLAQGAEAIITLITQSPRSRKSIRPAPRRSQHINKPQEIASPSEPLITKNRISKSYRIPELDKKIRERRTRAETKLLTKASQIINVPTPLSEQDSLVNSARVRRAGASDFARSNSEGKSKKSERGRELGGGLMNLRAKDKTKISMPFIDGKKLSIHLDKFPPAKQKSILKQIGKDIAKLHKENIIHGDLTTSNMILQKDKIFLIDFGLGYFNGKYEDKAVDIHLLKQALEAKHFKNWKTLFKEFEKGYNSINKTESKKVFERLKAVEKRGRYKH